MRIHSWKTRSIIFALAGMVLFCGCLGKSVDGRERHMTENDMSNGMSDFQFLEEMEAGNWKDNDLDDLHAILDLPIKQVTAEGELNGGTSSLFCGETGGLLFKNHVYSNYKNDWSGISGLTVSGGEFFERLEVDLRDRLPRRKQRRS